MHHEYQTGRLLSNPEAPVANRPSARPGAPDIGEMIAGFGGWGWVRTNVGASQQIYSLPPLATRAPTRNAPDAFSSTLIA